MNIDMGALAWGAGFLVGLFVGYVWGRARHGAGRVSDAWRQQHGRTHAGP